MVIPRDLCLGEVIEQNVFNLHKSDIEKIRDNWKKGTVLHLDTRNVTVTANDDVRFSTGVAVGHRYKSVNYYAGILKVSPKLLAKY